MYNKEEAFQRNIATMNSRTLRIGGYLLIFNILAFWVLDWFVFPRSLLIVTAFLRLIPAIVGAFIIYLTYKKKEFVSKHNFSLVIAMTFTTALVTGLKCWMTEGINSQYFIGICMMGSYMAVTCMLDSKQATILAGTMYLAYLLPLVYFEQFLPLNAFITNQAFFMGLVVSAITGQVKRIGSERLRFEQKLSNRNALARINKLATIDSLTGLKNRHYLIDVAGREIDRCRRHKRDAAVLILDLDHFKKINDVHGHAAGDIVLKCIGKMLNKSVRSIDIPCRYGGEEFVVVMPDISFADAVYTVVERIHNNLRSKPIALSEAPNSETLLITASIGVAMLQGEDDDLNSMIERADTYLYQAKNNGRNQTAFNPDHEKKCTTSFKKAVNS